MAMKLSAGLLLFRIADDRVEVLLVHMGGPFWARKDEHAWSVPKGEYEPGEDPADTAVREFTEELGTTPPEGPNLDLGSARQSGKTVTVFAREGDFDATAAVQQHLQPPVAAALRPLPRLSRGRPGRVVRPADRPATRLSRVRSPS